MQIDRHMVNLFFDIKRNLPANQRIGLTISAANLGETIVNLHKSSDDTNIKFLTNAFLERAGGGWAAKIRYQTTLAPQASTKPLFTQEVIQYD